MTNIAIIEDDQAIAQMYRIKFEAEGYKVETADNGVAGLALIEKKLPDIVLLDLMMPEMNGDEVLKRMRASSWGKHIKVIILTNIGSQEAPKVIHSLEVSAFIVKADMTPRQVAEIVKRILNS